MGFLETAQRRVGITPNKNSTGGVGTDPARAGRHGLGTGVLANLADDDDGTGWPNLMLRGFQTSAAFVNLIIYIALAVAQKRNGHVAGMTGWGLFFNVEVLLHSALFLATPLVYDRFAVLSGLARFLRQVRAGFIFNTTQSLLMLIACIASSVTAAKCSTLCSDEKAGAAFFWLLLFAWLASLALVGLAWHQHRNSPRSAPFETPALEFASDDPFDASDLADAPATAYAAGGGYRASGDYYDGQGERGLFSERAHEYEGVGGQRFEEDEEKYHPHATDPFEDQGAGQGYGWRGGDGGAGTEDPYEAIRKSMERANPRPSY